MATYSEHLIQAKSNLQFLQLINTNCTNHTDWQVTVCFYIGVHLINGFLAKESNIHFNSHERVKDAISPNSVNHKTKLDENTYLAYTKLRNLSRRSRYLCNSDNPQQDVEIAHVILEKHFFKAFQHLDSLLVFFYKKYGDAYNVTSIESIFRGKVPNCVYFKFSNPAKAEPAAADS